MGRTRCWHKNQGLQLIKWILWCWALKNVSINSSQQRDPVIFLPSLRMDSRAQGLATLGSGGGGKGGGFRKHNQGLTLRKKIAQVLVENVGAEPVVCWASLIGVKSDLLDLLRWTGVFSPSLAIPTVFSRTCVSVNKFVGLHCASLTWPMFGGREMKEWLCLFGFCNTENFSLSTSSFLVVQKEVAPVPAGPQTSYSFQFCRLSGSLCIS